MGERKYGRGVWKVNPNLLGGVSAGFEKERAQSIVDAVFGDGNLVVNETRAGTQDIYGPGRNVSIEAESERALNLQENLDKQVIQENLGQTPTTKGLPPCKRVHKDE